MLSSRQHKHRRVLRVTPPLALAAATIAAGGLFASPASAAGHGGSPGATRPAIAPVPSSAGAIRVRHDFSSPIPTSSCLKKFNINCYSPVQYRVAYNLNPLYAKGITGKGRTIVIVDSFGSPTIRKDLATFDAQWGFPNPSLTIVKAGKIPPFDPKNADMVGWAGETTLDVEYAHAIAPGARIILVETPVAETEGVTGFPQMMAAEKALIDAGVGDVISQSFGATENTFPGFAKGNYSSLLNLRYAFKEAARHGVTVLGASGDSGATDYQLDGKTLYPYRVNSWPSSDPLVTSVGGSQLYLDDKGNRLQPDSAWNDGYGAGGGGVSAVFGRPGFQNPVKGVVGKHRGTPDISMSSAVNGGCWVYSSYDPTDTGWFIYGGTSEATPIFSGIVALAAQVAGHRLGNINSKLTALALAAQHGSAKAGIVDITTGDNTFGGVTGYTAATGYDLATGWGTIDAARFVPALARLR